MHAADELPTAAGVDRLDALRLRVFVATVYWQPYPESPDALIRLPRNLNLAIEDDRLNLAGVLLFSKHQEVIGCHPPGANACLSSAR